MRALHVDASSPPAAAATLRLVRPSSRVAFVISWLVFLVTVVLAWRKVLAVPDGRGDVTGLTVATVAGAGGLVLLMIWLQEHERRDR
jgi:hypothetical protein